MPRCPGWADEPFLVIVVTAARFTHTAGVIGLQNRVGGITALAGIRYWSTTRKIWRNLFEEARALTSAAGLTGRDNFQPAEVTPGASLAFWVKERSPMDEMVYRAKILKKSDHVLSFMVDNLRPVRLLFQDFLARGDYQSYFQFRRMGGSNWTYYNVLRIAGSGGLLSLALSQSEASYINRAEAMYRYFAGIPTNMEPPAAR